MPRPKGSRGSGRRPNKKVAFLDSLKPQEAQTVLRRLLAAYPELLAEAQSTARAVLGEVSFEAIADEVEDAVRSLNLDDLHSHAGRHSWGYVEPSQAAQDLLEEALESVLKDMKRHFHRGLAAEALETCKGIVLGLYRVRNERDSGLLGWAPDFPEESAAWVVDIWRAGGDEQKAARRSRPLAGKGPLLPKDFVDQFVPEWNWLAEGKRSR